MTPRVNLVDVTVRLTRDEIAHLANIILVKNYSLMRWRHFQKGKEESRSAIRNQSDFERNFLLCTPQLATQESACLVIRMGYEYQGLAE